VPGRRGPAPRCSSCSARMTKPMFKTSQRHRLGRQERGDEAICNRTVGADCPWSLQFEFQYDRSERAGTRERRFRWRRPHLGCAHDSGAVLVVVDSRRAHVDRRLRRKLRKGRQRGDRNDADARRRRDPLRALRRMRATGGVLPGRSDGAEVRTAGRVRRLLAVLLHSEALRARSNLLFLLLDRRRKAAGNALFRPVFVGVLLGRRPSLPALRDGLGVPRQRGELHPGS
jgi:hypothetical protein